MEKYLESLNGITYREWQKLKLIVDGTFENIREKSTFAVTEDTLEHKKILN